MRAWLRRVMPRVAITAVLLIVLQAFAATALPEGQPLLVALQAAAVISSVLAGIYYGLKILRWVWRRLLWRVRRRLAITYLFVGLTPIVLMGALGAVSIWGTTSEAMARVVSTQIDALLRETAGLAQSAAVQYEGLPRDLDAAGLAAWIGERQRTLEILAPGARFELQPDASAAGGLPEWLESKETWSGLAYTPLPQGSEEFFTLANLRAVVRGSARGKPFSVLVETPVDGALAQRLHEATGLTMHLFFPGRTGFKVVADGRSLTIGERNADERKEAFENRVVTDQLGNPLPAIPYPILVQATDWGTGETTTRLVFFFDWSFAEAARQILGSSAIGRAWATALLVIGGMFLCLELAALLVAVLMTREVTGTVHELSRATDIMRKGDFSHRVRPRAHDQLGDLAKHFNDMSEHIEALLVERLARQRLEQEVQIAAQVQSQLFPRSVPTLVSAEITGECRAARGVAGDYYDYMVVGEGLIAFALGDVSGKGISASLVMSNLQASLRAQTNIMEESSRAGGAGASVAGTFVPAPRAARALAALAERINRQLCRSIQANRFATLVLGLYDDRTGMLRYTNAGHNAPILVRADGAVERLEAGGMIVGIVESTLYEEGSAVMEAGATLVVFSDGVSEAENTAGDQYGEDRLARFVVDHRRLGAVALQRALFNEIDRWADGQERNDDQTLVILKIHDVPRPSV